MRPGIGETLRAARRAQGRTLRDAAEATRVRETYLAALEQGEFGALGGEVYARGFLRSYARYLQLDPEPLLRQYADEAAGDSRPRGTSARRRERQPPGGSEGDELEGRDGHAGAARGQTPQERPPGAAILLLLVVVVIVVVAVVGLRAGDAGAAPTTGPPAVEVRAR